MRRRGFQGPAVHVALASGTFDEFFASEYPRLVPVLHALLGDRGRAESLATDVLGDVRKRWDDASADDDLAWTTLRTAVEQATRRSARATVVAATGPLADGHELPDAALWQAVNRLPRRERQVLALHYAGDEALTDVAALIGCSPTTLTSLLTSAQERLAAAFPTNAGLDDADRPGASGPTIDDYLGSDARPPDAGGYHEHIDHRLRTSGARIRALAPHAADAARVLADASMARRIRRRRWLVPTAVAAAAATVAVAVIVTLGDDGPTASSDMDLTSETSGPAPSAPPTTANGPQTTDRTRLIEPAPTFEAHYDTPTGYTWVTGEWDWDGDNGACVAVSRRASTPSAVDLERPRAYHGCVDGSRRDVVVTARLGDRMIHLEKGVSPRAWDLADRPFSRRRCGETPDGLHLAEGALYEIVCTGEGPVTRRFPRRPSGRLTLLWADGTASTARLAFNGDREADADGGALDRFEQAARGLRLYVTTDAKQATSCVIATVDGTPGWQSGCGDVRRTSSFVITAEAVTYIVRATNGRFRAIQTAGAPGGESLHCPNSLDQAFTALSESALWTAIACSPTEVLAAHFPPMTTARPDLQGDRLAVVERVGERWRVMSAADTDRAVNGGLCGRRMPCTRRGEVVLFPAGVLSPWSEADLSIPPDVVDGTAAMRRRVGATTDLGTVAVELSDRSLRGSGPPLPFDFGGPSIGITPPSYYAGEEFRSVTVYRWDLEEPGRNTYDVVWLSRRGDSDDWTVRAAFGITRCYDPGDGNPTRCDAPTDS